VAVVGQIDVDELLRAESRGLAFGVGPDLLAEDDAGDAAILAGHFPVGAGHQAAEEKLVSSRQALEFREGPLELLGRLFPARPLGSDRGNPFEELLLVGRGRSGIDGTGALDRRFFLPAVVVVVANHDSDPSSTVGFWISDEKWCGVYQYDEGWWTRVSRKWYFVQTCRP